MSITTKPTSGFTIVELLIVIVVIGVLAAITFIAFDGVNAKAREASMRSDLAGAAKSLKVYQIDYGKLPTNGTEGALVKAKFSFDTNNQRVVLCANTITADSEFAIVAQEPDGKQRYFAYDSATSRTTIVAPASTSAENRCLTTGHAVRLWGSFWTTSG